MRRSIQRSNVFGPCSLGAFTFVERYSLSFVQLLELDVNQTREVKEDVRSVALVNKSKSLVRQLLDCAFSHLLLPKESTRHPFGRET